ncbi:MAG TPA: ABC transporter substrate-binding protein [Candidatus Binatia bacterium]|nr:ABC transporter substrate-binding protein [Candidatus Binatia bacterium]
MMAILVCYTLCSLFYLSIYPIDAQESKNIPRLGFLSAGAAQDDRERLAVFREGLRELGYVEAKNILIEYRFAEGKLNRLPELAAGLARLNVNIILTAGNEAVQAAKNATQTIPIVMAFSGDPVGAGFVDNLARPGGNITGLSRINIELTSKRLELLNETVPSATRIAVLFNPEGRVPVLALKEAQSAAQKLGLQIQALEMQAPQDIESAFRSAARDRAAAIMTLPGGFTGFYRKWIVNLAAKSRLPGVYNNSRFVEDGGLMSYASDQREEFRRATLYVDRILKGAKHSDLPVEQPTKFELIINLKTAKQIGLTIPPNLLARADRIIR